MVTVVTVRAKHGPRQLRPLLKPKFRQVAKVDEAAMKWASTFGAAVLLGCCLMAACGPGDEFNASGPPYVSDVGALAKEVTRSNSSAVLYKNVMVYGNITVKDFERVCELVRPKLKAGETIYSINIDEDVLKEARRLKVPWGFIRVESCDHRDAIDCPYGGHVYCVGLEDGKLFVPPDGGMVSIWRY